MEGILRNPLSLFDAGGKVTVITGASGALGRAAAIALGALGGRMLLASGSADGLAEVAAEVREAGGEASTLTCRPDTQADADAILAAAVKAYGQVDSVLVASGYNKPAPIEDMPYEDWQAIMDANVRGPWLIAKAFGQLLARDERRGKLLLVSSVRGRQGSPAGYSAYCTSKGAVRLMSKALAVELGKLQIRVNSVHPGLVETPLGIGSMQDMISHGVPLPSIDAALSMVEQRTPLGRMAQPQDVANVIAFLCADESRYVTGTELTVDGGYSIN